MIKAVLFDMNGVIINDEHIHELAFKQSVQPFGITLSHSDYLACCAGKTDQAGYEQIAQMFETTLPIQQLLFQKSQLYLSLFPHEKQAYPGVIEVIQKLSSDFVLAITSSSSRAEVNLVTKEFGVKNYFSITVSANEVLQGKPNPEPYLTTAELLNCAPSECVVIEDSSSGVQAAKTAGCYCIGITTTHTAKDLALADVVIADFAVLSKSFITSLERP